MVQLRCGDESPKGQKRIEKLVGSCHGTSLSCEWSIFGVVSCLGGGWGGGVGESCCHQSVSVCRLSCPQCEHEHAQGLKVTKIMYRYTV